MNSRRHAIRSASRASLFAVFLIFIEHFQVTFVALRSDLSSVYRYKGSVANYASLPAGDSETGDVWNVEATGMNYAWTGQGWDALGETIQIESITNAEIDAMTEE